MLYEHMKTLTPLPSIYLSESIAENQAEVADNVLAGTKSELVDQVREQIRDFKEVLVRWTGNGYAESVCGLIGSCLLLLSEIRYVQTPSSSPSVSPLRVDG